MKLDSPWTLWVAASVLVALFRPGQCLWDQMTETMDGVGDRGTGDAGRDGEMGPE
jgi:hypothetical protein